MHSRAIVLLSLFALACVIVAGSIAFRFTTASASADDTIVSSRAERIDRPGNDPQLSASADHATSRVGSGNSNDSAATDNRRISGVLPVELTARELATADTLETMLGQVHRLFGSEGSVVSNAMIPHLAEMITVINQYEHLLYLVEIVEPDAVLAQERAQTLNDVLRLNVLEPSQLQIIGRAGSYGTHVDVTPI